jgi:hypothetical protein
MTKQDVYVESNTAQLLAAEASNRGRTLYSLTNEILDVALQVFGQGGDANELFPAWKSFRISRDIDGAPFLPRSLVWKMVERLYQRDPDWLLQEWFESGRRLGEVLRTFHPTLEDLRSGMSGIPSLITEQRIELERQSGSKEGPPEIRVRVVTDLTPELSACGESLLLGLLSSYSFRATATRKEDGIIEINAIYAGTVPTPATKTAPIDMDTATPS